MNIMMFGIFGIMAALAVAGVAKAWRRRGAGSACSAEEESELWVRESRC